MASRFFSTQEMEKSAMDKSDMRQGQTASWNSFSLRTCDQGGIILWQQVDAASFAGSADLISEMLWRDTGAPKNMKAVLRM